MAARKQHSTAYQAWTYTLAGLLALTNAAWFLSSRITANDHAAAMAAARAATAPAQRVVHEYRAPPRQEPQRTRGTQRLLEPHEQCRVNIGGGGLVFAKIGNEWSSSGEACDPTLV